jgi:UDPglucose--hexose-1-phosphate uridylyltransferase
MENINEETELRNNLLTGDWVIIAPMRGTRLRQDKSTTCPFCSLRDQEKPILIYNNGKVVNDTKKWTAMVLPNKYPVFVPLVNECSQKDENCYKIKSSGYHELVITKDHNKDCSKLSISSIKEVLDCYQQRIFFLKKSKSVNYIFIFQNYGPKAGASQVHPHSQILTIPFIDKELKTTLSTSEKYFKKNGRCLHCDIIKKELSQNVRVIFENDSFVAYIPFAPKFIYQVIIAPKAHKEFFENISEKEKYDLAEVMKLITTKFNRKLDNPSYNFYVNNSPCDNKNYDYFHWYMTFIPRLTNLGGFEVGVNMETITKYPEDQAQFLKK